MLGAALLEVLCCACLGAAPLVAPLFASVFTLVGSFVFMDLVYMQFAGRQPAFEGLERLWWYGGSLGWTRCLWSSVVSWLTGVPRSLFYLVGASGRRLQENATLAQSGIGPDSSL